MLRPCPACRRHVAAEPACPFCGALLPEPTPGRPLVAGRLSRAAVFASATLAGCWTNANEPRTTPIEQHEATDTDKPHDKVDTTAKDTHREVHTAASSIEGTLTDGASGQPASNLTIRLIAQNGKAQSTQTDLHGHYVFSNVEPGTYQIEWDITGNPHRAPRRATVMIGEAAKVTFDLTMTFQTQSTIPMPYGAPPARKRVV